MSEQSETRATSPAKLASSKAWKLRNKERNDALVKAHNDAVRLDPAKWAKKLEQNRTSWKKHAKKRSEYDRARDKEKTRARQRIRNFIFRGKLTRGSCEVCSLPNADAHHDDYSKPLEIRWLCRKHHKEYHVSHPEK